MKFLDKKKKKKSSLKFSAHQPDRNILTESLQVTGTKKHPTANTKLKFKETLTTVSATILFSLLVIHVETLYSTARDGIWGNVSIWCLYTGLSGSHRHPCHVMWEEAQCNVCIVHMHMIRYPCSNNVTYIICVQYMCMSSALFHSLVLSALWERLLTVHHVYLHWGSSGCYEAHFLTLKPKLLLVLYE